MNKIECLSYLNGVIHGDAWLTDKSFGLLCKDRDFSDFFRLAVKRGLGIWLAQQIEVRGGRKYWMARRNNTNSQFDIIRSFNPHGKNLIAWWLRGLFDSEGHAGLLRMRRVSQHSYQREVSMSSTNTKTIRKAVKYLKSLGMKVSVRRYKRSSGHLGDKPVFSVFLKSSKENFSMFSGLVGSSIARKMSVLIAIPQSYKPDLRKHCQMAQLIGAKAKHDKFMIEKFPAVISGIRQLIRNGIKPTQRNCGSVPHFTSAQRYFSQSHFVRLALK